MFEEMTENATSAMPCSLPMHRWYGGPTSDPRRRPDRRIERYRVSEHTAAYERGTMDGAWSTDASRDCHTGS